MKIWFKKLHIWISDIAATKWGSLALFVFAFADASFLPLPVTTFFLIILMLNTTKVIKMTVLVVTGTLLGSLAGYSIGHFAWFKPNGELTGAVQFILNNIPGFSHEVYAKVQGLFNKWDFWILGAATASPLPYGMFSITSGVFGINIFIFLISTLIYQGLKFSLIAAFSIKLIPQFKKIKLNWKPVAIVTSASILVTLVVLRVVL